MINSRPRHFIESKKTPLLPKLRGHFAEFLRESYLAPLGLLDLPTCVSLWYRSIFINSSTGFSRKPQCYSVFFRRLHFKWLRPPVLIKIEYRNIRLFPIDYAFRPDLRS